LKIINMDKFQEDEADRKLRELFGQAHVADDGFSEQVIHRINRDAWRRRLLMALAIVPGGLIAAGPAWQLINRLGTFVAAKAGGIAVSDLPLAALQNSVTAPAVIALVSAVLVGMRMLED
jgi:hypothetical protein